MKPILIVALLLTACGSTPAPVDNDAPAPSAGTGIKVDSATGVISVDSAVVPTAPSCANGQVVTRTATGWACAAQAPDATMLGGQPAASYLTTSGTAANSAQLGGLLPSAFLGASAMAADSAKLNGKSDTAFLGATATAADWAKLGGQPAASYLTTSGTAANSAQLGGQPAASYLTTSGTAANSAKLGGQLPAAFLGANAQAVDSARLGGQLASTFLTTSGNAASATNAANLGGVAASRYARNDVPASMTMPLNVNAADGSLLQLGGGTVNGIYGANTGGNLHLDSGNQIYLNWTSGTGVVFGNGTASAPASMASVDSATVSEARTYYRRRTTAK
jgi:hypothetical protein